MSFPRYYPKYKESGVEWLGQVPEHWEVTLSKRFITVKSGDMISAEEEAEAGFQLVGGNGLRAYTSKWNTLGDTLVIGRVGAKCGCVHHIEENFWASEHAFCVIEKQSLSKRFFFHLLSALELNKFAIKTAQPLLNTEIVETQWISVPPFAEQTRIAEFLDVETGKIDALVAEQERLMALLKEKRQAVISHAVTKGLNPKAPMKPSGIEWLSDVPTHWTLKKMKQVSSLKGRLGWQGLKAEEYRDEGPFVVSSAHFDNFGIEWNACPHVSTERYELDNNIQLNNGDVLLMKDGAALGKLAYIDRLPDRACLNSHLLLFRPLNINEQDTYISRFLFFLMRTDYFQEHITLHATGTTFLGISQEEIGNYRLALPPLDEQAEIVSYLENEVSKFDTLNAEAQRAIDLLQERRTALISAAVTGQIDVRNTLNTL